MAKVLLRPLTQRGLTTKQCSKGKFFRRPPALTHIHGKPGQRQSQPADNWYTRGRGQHQIVRCHFEFVCDFRNRGIAAGHPIPVIAGSILHVRGFSFLISLEEIPAKLNFNFPKRGPNFRGGQVFQTTTRGGQVFQTTTRGRRRVTPV